MASKTGAQEFQQSWQKTAAWAQSQGIPYDSYYPIYQKDAQNFLTYNSQMSAVDRERAIVAANDPSSISQTPQTSPRASNVVGNTLTDLRNIFTGLGDIVIHPLHNGIANSIGNTIRLLYEGGQQQAAQITGNTTALDNAHAAESRLTGMDPNASKGTQLEEGLGWAATSTALSFIPGVADVGTVLNSDTHGKGIKGGLETLATHPVSSALDVLPAANKLVELRAAASPEFASRFGVSAEGAAAGAQKASLGRAVKGYILNTQTGKVGPRGMTAEGDIGPMSVGDIYQNFLGKTVGNSAIAQAMYGLATKTTEYTNYQQVISAEFVRATEDFDEAQVEQLRSFLDARNPLSFIQRVKRAEAEGTVDPKVVDAAQKLEDGPLRYAREQSLLTRAHTLYRHPLTGNITVATTIAHASVITARRAAELANDEAMRMLPEMEGIAKRVDDGTAAAADLAGKIDQANLAARDYKPGPGSVGFDVPSAPNKIPIPKSEQAIAMFGPDGFVDKLTGAIRDGEWDTAEGLSRVIQRRLTAWGVKSADAAASPAYQAVEQLVMQVEPAVKAVSDAKKEAADMIYGKAKDRGRITDARQQARNAEANTLRKQVNDGRRALAHSFSERRKALDDTRRADEQALRGQYSNEARLKRKIRDLDLQYEKDNAALDREQKTAMKQYNAKAELSRKALAKAHAENLDAEGPLTAAYKAVEDAQKAFEKEAYDHPPDVFRDVVVDTVIKNMYKSEEAQATIAKVEKRMAEDYGWTKEDIARERSNPAMMGNLATAIINATYKDDPMWDETDKAVVESLKESYKVEADRLVRAGYEPMYIPHISSEQVNAEETGSYGIRLIIGHGEPKPDADMARVWDLTATRFDAVAGVSKAAAQALEKDTNIEYVNEFLAPHVVTGKDLLAAALTYKKEWFYGGPARTAEDVFNVFGKEWNLTKFDPKGMFGFTSPRWAPGDTYINKSLSDAVEKVANRESSLNAKALDKATGLYRFSILALSPRYTLHILGGGTMLLAYRSSVYAPLFLRKAHQMVTSGEQPAELLTTPTQMGGFNYAVAKVNYAAAKTLNRLRAEEHITTVQKVALSKASPIHWVKAAGDLNIRFTSYVVNMQRAVAYLDGAAKTTRRGYFLDENGVRVSMTPERAAAEGMHHAAEVMGDLRRMSPLERQVARSVMPFYGWTRHVLQYVLSFPADHPWRAMMLANMAEYGSENVGAGLPTRLQFMFFFGHPDAQGNVPGVDLRFMDPLRDTANYASFAGILSSLNPVLSAPLIKMNPDSIYGSQELYPNLSYDQFYGIEVAGSQGTWTQTAAAFVPQLTALESAMKLAGNIRGSSKAALTKSVFENTGTLAVDLQNVNLKQLQAKDAEAAYKVALQASQNAWQTGDFSGLAGMTTVPDPRYNGQYYDTSVDYLKNLYAWLAQEYPGQAPSETAPPLKVPTDL